MLNCITNVSIYAKLLNQEGVMYLPKLRLQVTHAPQRCMHQSVCKRCIATYDRGHCTSLIPTLHKALISKDISLTYLYFCRRNDQYQVSEDMTLTDWLAENVRYMTTNGQLQPKLAMTTGQIYRFRYDIQIQNVVIV